MIYEKGMVVKIKKKIDEIAGSHRKNSRQRITKFKWRTPLSDLQIKLKQII